MELVFLATLVLLMVISLSSGFPVAFALPGSAIGAIALAALCGYLFAGDPGAYFAQDGPVQWLKAGITNFRSLYWQVERDTLIAIPLFVFMGIMLQRSKIAEDLLVAMAQLFGPVPGGLGISVVFVGALLAATTGILGATVIAMGLISLPVMIKNNYSKSLAAGTICASGTLGQIIPPSIVLIILADQLANAADQARTIRTSEYKAASGEFSMPAQLDITSASAGDMFMGALIPGLILVGLYMTYILVIAILKPGSAPPVPYGGKYNRAFYRKTSVALVPPLTLIFVVLGSIIAGIATVNQAGAIGAVGAIVMGGYRLKEDGRHRYTPLIITAISLSVIFILLTFFSLNIKNISNEHDRLGIWLAVITVIFLLGSIIWSGWRTYKINDTLTRVMIDTAKTTSMVFIILIGAAMLTAAFRAFGGEHLVREFLTSLPGGFWMQFMVVMLVIFLLGFFLDFIEIAVVVVPIVAPILLADPGANITAVWLGVMIGLNMQTSFLTPPFGFALFYLRGVASKKIKTTHIYKGAIAFIALQLLALVITGTYPNLVNYMPNRTFLTSDTAPPPVNPKLQLCIERELFEFYAHNEQKIRNDITLARKIDLSVLPKQYQKQLTQSFGLAEKTFQRVREVNVTTADLESYEVNYRSLHAQVRTIYRKISGAKLEIKNLKGKLKNRHRNKQTDNNIIANFENQIAQLEQHILKLQSTIPDSWDEARKSYKVRTNAEKKARTAYRKNVDEAYLPVKDILHLLANNQKLKHTQPDIISLANHIQSDSPENAIKKIKEMESLLFDIPGSSNIKSTLAKSRRALRGDSADINKALEMYQQAALLLQQEITWREQVPETTIDQLKDYHRAIKRHIGVRQQPRLETALAKEVAACLSVHKDISLHF